MVLYTRLAIIECVKDVYTWLNILTPKNGISSTILLRAFVTGITNTFGPHMITPFGTYAHVHNETDNSMQPRTTAAIALRSMGKVQGVFHFFSLKTGGVIASKTWTNLPMPDDVIRRVSELRRKARALEGVTFKRKDDSILTDASPRKPANNACVSTHRQTQQLDLTPPDPFHQHPMH